MGARERAIMVVVDDLDVAVPRKRTRKTRNGGVKQEVKEKFMHEHQAKPIIAKNDAQKHYLHSLQFDTVSVGKGSAGTGKAQPLYSKILTDKGWVTMGEISVGDIVRSIHGWTEVTGVFPQGKKEIVRFHFKDGGSIDACVDHLWTVDSNAGSNGKTSKKVRSTLTSSEIIEILDSKTGGNIGIPRISPIELQEKDYVLDPYIVGVLLGDGCLRGTTLSITSKDGEVLAELDRLLPEGCSLSKWNSSDISFGIVDINSAKNHSNVVRSQLLKYGLLGKLSHEKFVPSDYKVGSISQRYALLRGLMDTDGTISKNGSVSFCTTSEQLALDVREVVLSLGGKASISESTKCFTHNGIKKQGRNAFIVSINVEDKSKLFTIKRKLDRVCKTQIPQLSRLFSSYELIGKEDCQCIMVKDESHLYVSDDYILTHNTYCAAAVAANKYLKGEISEIVVARAYVPMGKTTGFWPGTVEEKLLPFLTPILNVIKERVGANRYLAEFGKTIKIQPLEAIRGMSFPAGTFLIIDESQNLNVDEVRSIVTRLEEGSQVAFCGDDKQRDIRGVSGIVYLTNLIKKYNLPNCSVTEFTPKDIVRSGLTKAFVEIFEKEGSADNVKEEDFE